MHRLAANPRAFKPSEDDAHTFLELYGEDMKNCTLTSRYNVNDGYDVQTKDGTITIRSLSLGETIPVAVVEKHDVRSDRITFGAKEQIKASKWMKSSFFAPTPATVEIEGQKYTWKQVLSHGYLCLFNSTDSKNPVAWLKSSERITLDGQVLVQPPSLVLKTEVAEPREKRDQVVVLMMMLVQQVMFAEGFHLSHASARPYIGDTPKRQVFNEAVQDLIPG